MSRFRASRGAPRSFWRARREQPAHLACDHASPPARMREQTGEKKRGADDDRPSAADGRSWILSLSATAAYRW